MCGLCGWGYVALLLGYVKASFTCKFFHRFWKAKMFQFHQKADGIAARAAAKAIVKLLVRCHAKRRCLFFVEWTASRIITATAFEFNAAIYNIDDVGSIEQIVDKVLGDAVLL